MTHNLIAQEISRLAGGASFEILPATKRDFLKSVSPGTRIHITDFSNPGRDADRSDTIAIARQLQNSGMIPVPHIAARRVANQNALESILTRMDEASIKHVMVIAGDGQPAGEFSTSMCLLTTELFTRFNSVAVAGHPAAGKTTTPDQDQATSALSWKNAHSRMQNQNMRIVTQLEYDPDVILNWTSAINSAGNTLPVHIGMTGRASFSDKTKYAYMCGINVARIVQNQGSKLFQMFSSEVPDGLVTRLAQSRLEPQKEGLSAIAGLHFFTFGVAPKTADFIKAMKDGAFRMKPDNDGFDLN